MDRSELLRTHKANYDLLQLLQASSATDHDAVLPVLCKCDEDPQRRIKGRQSPVASIDPPISHFGLMCTNVQSLQVE